MAAHFPYGSRPFVSPRYTSDGQYATRRIVAPSTRNPIFSGAPRHVRERRSSFSHPTSDWKPDDDKFTFPDCGPVPGAGRSRRNSTSVPPTSMPQRPQTPRPTKPSPSFSGPPRRVRKRRSFSHPTSAAHWKPDDDEFIFTSRRHGPDCGPVPGAGRSRRNSTSVPPTSMPQRPQTPQPTKPPPRPRARQATAVDARRHGIPEGYSVKNWDPDEEPIILARSVFDANSLGEWIYKWSIYHSGRGSPTSKTADELWFLLVQLSGKIKSAKEAVPRIRSTDDWEMVDGIIEDGAHITDKFKKLLKGCEASMRTKEKGGWLGKSAGVEFVETLFGADRKLGETQSFMSSARLYLRDGTFV